MRVPTLLLCWLFTLSLAAQLAEVDASTDDPPQHGLGLVFEDDEVYQSLKLSSSSMMGTLPPAVDLSEWFPAPGDQGMQSSCVGWAVGYGLKSYHEALESGVRPNSRDRMFSPAYIYNQIKIGHCGGGSSILRALELLRDDGVASMSDFPYDPGNCTAQPDATLRRRAKSYVIGHFKRIDFKDEVEVKGMLNSQIPVVIGMRVDEAFERQGPGDIYDRPGGRQLGGHAMIVVGYDDARGAYKILNSWGRSFGTNGYAWVSYAAFARTVKQAFTAQDVRVKSPTSSPEPPVVLVHPDELFEPVPHVPVPVPVNARDISVEMSRPMIMHNQMVQSPKGTVAGMAIRVPGYINRGQGATAQMIVRFYSAAGRPLYAHPSEPYFRDTHGGVAVGTAILPVYNNHASTENMVFYIPYYALNLPASNYANVYQLQVRATLYVNEFEEGHSDFSALTVRW